MNHYEWLEENFPIFLERLSIDFKTRCPGIITCHGDKVYGYKDIFKKLGIHFFHGCALYLLTHLTPWSTECRDKGVFNFEKWLYENKGKFLKLLPPIDEVLGKCIICKKDVLITDAVTSKLPKYPNLSTILYNKIFGYICACHHGVHDHIRSLENSI